MLEYDFAGFEDIMSNLSILLMLSLAYAWTLLDSLMIFMTSN